MSARGRATTTGSGSPSRIGFVDLARAIAVLMMIQGHTLDAVLAPEFRQGPVFDNWTFARGLTSCLFLLLSGFAFGVATRRRWTQHLAEPAAWLRRFRRFAFFILLGYMLHFPVGSVADLQWMTEERWAAFLKVDVLQCIGTMLIVLQVLVIVTRTPNRFVWTSLALCAAVLALTPRMWAIDWTQTLPVALAAYLGPHVGSQFPLFPWMAYGLLGAALGDLYAHRGAAHLRRFAHVVLFGGGIAALAASHVFWRLPVEPFGPSEYWTTSPNVFLMRTGFVLLVLCAVAHCSLRFPRPHLVISALAAESLVIYFVHLVIVYGSVWNDGLRQHVGPTLTPVEGLGWVAALWASMTLLAWAWSRAKHAWPTLARVFRYVVWIVLVSRLL